MEVILLLIVVSAVMVAFSIVLKYVQEYFLDDDSAKLARRVNKAKGS